ncbi:hypothetical protein N7474_006052 [Penicillium riverlandense]|uniref:uncharacterized protein n=1 Tax=Penicillium riverlandense TaxID=1903569 RepID=UPI002549624D|nr:uncharacterized protein N7474_006052 [Penicillium riverlandense]KAJ5820461.1 hypothetical protein N7474_006052 [Penicillium riverlandense]
MSTSPTMPMKSQAKVMEEPASFSNEPRWAMGSSVFDNLEQELKAARNEKNVLSRTPALRTSFFQHGLRYIPGRHDNDLYRSVVVENLPPHANLGQILLGIRGGAIYSAILCDTNVLTGTQTALVTFVRQEGALAFLQRVAQDDFYIGFHQAWVCPVLTPTYPLAPEMDIYVKNGRTRCLAVNRVRPGVVQNIHRILSKSPCHLYVEYFGENPSACNEIRVHFHSIKMAMRAREILAGHASLEGCGILFAPDPCAM